MEQNVCVKFQVNQTYSVRGVAFQKTHFQAFGVRTLISKLVNLLSYIPSLKMWQHLKMIEGSMTWSIQFYPPFTISYIVEFVSGISLIMFSSKLGQALKYICDTPSPRMLPTVASEFLAHVTWAYFFCFTHIPSGISMVCR